MPKLKFNHLGAVIPRRNKMTIVAAFNAGCKFAEHLINIGEYDWAETTKTWLDDLHREVFAESGSPSQPTVQQGAKK